MKVGDVYTEKVQITEDHIKKFADFSGDFNTVHFDNEAAKAQGFKGRIAHGMLSASFFSKIFATTFPGPGAVYLGQNLKFHAPVYLNDTVTFRLEVIAEKEGKPIFTIKTEALNSEGGLYISGDAVIRSKV